MGRPIKLSVVRSERQRSEAKEIRRSLYHHIGEVVRGAGDEIAGFAVVVWDKRGGNWSTLKGGGPIMTRLAPSFVRDSLNQHVAVNMTKEELK